MKIKYECLPCLVNQIVKVAEITNAENKDELFRKIFTYLATIDFTKSNPEIIGATFRMLKQHTQNPDPYHMTRDYYNRLFLSMLPKFEFTIDNDNDPFEMALKYAIVGNVIDFNPIHHNNEEDIMKWFVDVQQIPMHIHHMETLKQDLTLARQLLYIGDNCGEICLDKLFIKKIKAYYPSLKIYFGVRGDYVVNDSVAEDAVFVGMEEYASIISNGDDSLGTILSRTSTEFRQIFDSADIIIAKGQANYESLSEEMNKNIYFLLISKCDVIAKDIGVPQNAVICMNNKKHQ